VYETARREDTVNANTETAHYYLQPVGQALYRIIGLDYALIEPTEQLGFQ
jgi:hypothetical protein